MRLSYNEQWALSLVSLALLIAAVIAAEIMGSCPPHLWSTFVILAAGMVLLVNHSAFSFEVIGFAIIFFPALAPAYAWSIEGKELFSLAAQYIQYDTALVDKAVFLFSVAAVSYTAMAAPRLPRRALSGPGFFGKLQVLPKSVLYVIAALTIISGFAIESGPTILTADYETVLASRLERTHTVIFLVTVFGGLWSLLFVFGRQRKVLFWGVTLFVCIWLLLHSRRVEVSGIVLVMIIWGQYRIRRSSLVLIVTGILALQIAIGFVRYQGVMTMLHGNSISAAEQAGLEKAALPGGASNIFLSGLHLVDVKDNELLEKRKELTMLQWPLSLIPNFVLRSIEVSPVRSEHQSIYEELELNYVGGMPLLTVFYLNGGVVLVIVYGMLHGIIARHVSRVIKRDLSSTFYGGGTLPMLIVTVFLVYQFRYHWYNPLTLFRSVELAVLMAVVVGVVVKLVRAAGQYDPGQAVANRPRA